MKKKSAPPPVRRYAPHPRYGSGPSVTGLNPSPNAPGTNLHWNATDPDELTAQIEAAFGTPSLHAGLFKNAPRKSRIPGTAIKADLTRQVPATVPVTHYFNVERICADCKEPFIFYAREQKHWYEELGFPLEAQAIRCARCRKAAQKIARTRKTYEDLLAKKSRSPNEHLKLLEALLHLIEKGIFSAKKIQAARALLKKISEPDQQGFRDKIDKLEAR